MLGIIEIQGGMSWPCQGGFNLGTSCTERILIDALNLAFIIVYCLALVHATTSHRGRIRTTNKMFLVVSIFCAAIGITLMALYVRALFGVSQAFLQWTSLVLLLRGLVWIFVAISLNFCPTKSIRVLVSIWWSMFSLCITGLYLKNLVEFHSLHVLEVVTWPVNLVLLFCSFKLVSHVTHEDSGVSSLSQALLVEDQKTTGLREATFLRKITFSWLNPLLHLGRSKPLEINDIPNLDVEDTASSAYTKFTEAWELQRKDGSRTKNLALFALARCYKNEMLLVALYAMLKRFSVVAAPLLLFKFVEYSRRTDPNLREGLFLVALLQLTKIVESLSDRHNSFNSRRCGMRMRSSLMAAVFRKQLLLTTLGRRNHSRGDIVNYIAVDAYRLGEFPRWFHMAWSSTLQLILAIGILLTFGGVGAMLGLIPLVICGSLNIPFARFLQRCQHQFMDAQDQRLQATSETLNSMKIIKLQSWEENFRLRIQSLREKEFKWLKHIQTVKSYGTGLYWMAPTIVSAVIFVGCALTSGASLDAGTIFTILATLRVMSEPVRVIPEALSVMIQVKVSLDRLDVFLLEDEMKEDINIRKLHDQNASIRICINTGTFSWDNDASNPTLKCINLEIGTRQKIAICGTVGAGKSSLLYAILGEIPRITGTVDVYGSIAYVSQTSWLQGGTIRDNILLGKSMNKKRYKMAIKACALDKDIENLDHGDLTEIGQRGLNMSGGQKQRIQLARAVYNDADIYLLDDTFSAVDAHTAATLFNDCIMAALSEKTVILVTHQIEFLTEVDKILVMNEGHVIQSGTYEELLRSCTVFERFVDAHKSGMTSVDQANHESWDESQKTEIYLLDSNALKSDRHNSEVRSVKETSMVQLTKDEEKEIGYGGWKPYLQYINVPNGPFQLFIITFSQILFVVLQMLSTYWLAVAAEIPHLSKEILIGTYTVVSAASCIFVCIRSWFGAKLGLNASMSFFSGIMDSMFKAPMLFFDSTPVGRILTRAASDMSVLDFDLPFELVFTLGGGLEILNSILVMAVVTWQVLVVAIPIAIATRYVQMYYLSSARELVRINGTTKAPVVNYAAETSLGVITIRAFTETKYFIQKNLKHIDIDATTFFHTIAAMEWILLRVEILQNITILTSSLLLVLLPQYIIAPGFVGLSLSYALNLTGAQVFFTRWYTSFDNHIISVERIKQFMHIPPEAPAIIEDHRPNSSWPDDGRIDFVNLKIKYRPNAPLVLKGITCACMAGEKIGIVGRTGSGKTTLISALFRLVEPTDGKILIDNLDIGSIGLKDLRMKLSIIPQEPTLFKGSVRSNLDPLSQYTDKEIWEALEKCQLKATINDLPDLLDSSVSDEGENWSVGQRQLFCLGRVLLRRNKILVLDEATASIDTETDATLQKIIRKEFSSCTVITVAHRVPTVMDSDKVMVLSYGNLLEYDNPSNLMGTTSSFSKLVTEYWSNRKKKSS